MPKDFSIKFVDIMVGVVLGLGFQWWAILREPWQFIAFLFAYVDTVDYWIDYGPALKKFPPRKEIDVLLDVGIIFSLFLYIYATQISVIYFLTAFILLRVLDFFWLLSSRIEYHPQGADKTYINTWLYLDCIEAAIAGALIIFALVFTPSSLFLVAFYIFYRIMVRVFASINYRKVYFS